MKLLRFALLSSALNALAADGLAPWIERLGDPDLAAREEAARAILDQGKRDPEGVLAQLARPHPDPEVEERCRALQTPVRRARIRLQALAAAGDDEEIQRLVEEMFRNPAPTLPLLADAAAGRGRTGAVLGLYLADPLPEIRAGALQVLRRDGVKGEDALPLVAPLVTDPDPEVRLEAVRSLDFFKGEAHAGQVVPLLADPDPNVRVEAANFSKRFLKPAAAGALFALFEHPDPSVRQQAAWLAGSLGDPASAVKVVPLLKDGDVMTRYNALFALAELKAASAVPEILPLLSDKDVDVQMAVMSVLGELADPATIRRHLEPFLAHAAPRLTISAAWVLILKGDGDKDRLIRALGPLLSASEVPPQLQDAAGEALGTLLKKPWKGPAAAEPARRWWKENGAAYR